MSNRIRRLTRYNAPRAASPNRLGVASIEAWPAAGGGLLVGLAEPAFAGAAPIRTTVKTAFLRLDGSGEILLLIPYVTLEAETRECARAVVSDQLRVPASSIAVSDGRIGGRFQIVDLPPAAERSLQACAAAARTLLLQAAAETWRVSSDRCQAADGLIRARRRMIAYRDLAADAALCPMPDQVRLHCGSLVAMGLPDCSVVRAEVSPIPTSK